MNAWVQNGVGPYASTFVFHTQHDESDSIDYIDDPLAGVVAIRRQDVGLIICANDHGDLQRTSADHLQQLGYLPVFSCLEDLELGPLQFREVFAWASTIQRSRSPFPFEGAAFGRFDSTLHEERLEFALALHGYERRDVAWPFSLLFTFDSNGHLRPRFTSLVQTRAWAAERRVGPADR